MFEERVIAGEIEFAFRIEHADERQVMPPPDLEVVEVVRRRDLDRAGALLRIGILVGDDRDAAADQRQDRVAADELGVALVARMHRHRGVAEHRFRPRRRDRDEGRRSISSIGYLMYQRCPCTSTCCTSRSEIAVSSFGSQLTSRLSL